MIILFLIFFFFVLKKWKQDTFILLLWIPTIEIKLLCTKTGMLGLNPDFFWEIFLPKLISISLPVLTRGCCHSGSVCLENSGIKEKEGCLEEYNWLPVFCIPTCPCAMKNIALRELLDLAALLENMIYCGMAQSLTVFVIKRYFSCYSFVWLISFGLTGGHESTRVWT